MKRKTAHLGDRNGSLPQTNRTPDCALFIQFSEPVDGSGARDLRLLLLPPASERKLAKLALPGTQTNTNKNPGSSRFQMPEHSRDAAEEPGKVSADEKSLSELHSVFHPQTPGSSFRPRSSLPSTAWLLPFVVASADKGPGPLPSRAFRLLCPPKANLKTFGNPGEPVSAGWGKVEPGGCGTTPSLSLSTFQLIWLGRYCSEIRSGSPEGTPGLPWSVALNASAQVSWPLQSWDRSRGYCPWC